jgi:hypothetical protein
MNTPTYAYAYKYAAFDGLSRAPGVIDKARRDAARRRGAARRPANAAA